MSKRLQVVLPDTEMSDIQRSAKRERLTVGEWVRRVLRAIVRCYPHAMLCTLRSWNAMAFDRF